MASNLTVDSNCHGISPTHRPYGPEPPDRIDSICDKAANVSRLPILRRNRDGFHHRRQFRKIGLSEVRLRLPFAVVLSVLGPQLEDDAF